MSGGNNSALTKLVGRIFPKVPDFFGMLVEQSTLAATSTAALVEYMETGSDEAAQRVLSLEKEGDVLKDRHVDQLNQAFSTPMDREDLYRAIVSIDEILNYAKTTVREMQVLGVAPDAVTLEMAGFLRDGEDQPVRVEARREGTAFLELVMSEGGGIGEAAHGAAFTPRRRARRVSP